MQTSQPMVTPPRVQRDILQLKSFMRREVRRDRLTEHLGRIELDLDDSATLRQELRSLNDRYGFQPSNVVKFLGIPVLMDRPETRVVRWDEYERLKVLSATCFTPDPR